MSQQEKPTQEGHVQGDVNTTPNLPWEIWGHVLSFLSPVMRGIARGVCREWRTTLPKPAPAVMQEASLLLKEEGFRELSDWTISRGCQTPFRILLGRGEVTPLVITNGSHMTCAGFAGDDAPRSVSPSLIGRSNKAFAANGIHCGWGVKDTYVGDEAHCYKGFLHLSSPMQHGIVRDWEGMEKIWHHTFYNELRVDPEEHPVLLSEAILNPRANREMMTQIMMEQFNVPALYVARRPLLAFYSTGRNTAITMCLGEGVAQALPITNGYSPPRGAFRHNFGGRDITDRLKTLLLGSGYDLTSSSAEHETVRDIKEKLCYVAEDYETERRVYNESDRTKNYELPDGQVIRLGSELFRCTEEVLFQPNLVGSEIPGIHELVYNAITNCPIDCRKDFYGNIVVTGGSSMFPGLADRLQREVTALAPATMKVKVIAPPERKYATWIGGSILSSLSTFQSNWMFRQSYDEHGPSLAHTLFH